MKLKRIRRLFREPFAWLGTRALEAVVQALPFRALAPLAAGLGALVHGLPPARRLIHANLAVAFPDLARAERDRLCRAACRHLARTVLEFVWFGGHPGALRAAVDADPSIRERFDTARGGVPMVFLTPHVGNWELGGQMVAVWGIPVDAVGAQYTSRAVERMIHRLRHSTGLGTIPAGGAVRGIVQAVRAGRSIGLLMDQNTSPKKGGIFVSFFGLPVATSRAPAALARRLRIEIVPAALVRENGRFRLWAEPLPRPVAAYASDEELTRDLMAANERFIRRYPEQYLWLYRRWRYIPADASAAERARFPYYAGKRAQGGAAGADAPPREGLAAAPEPGSRPQSGV
jgi:KDO2-lipid IV(A) lauroyltransferase